MGQHVYWHAPIWEVLLIALASLGFIGWLILRALRRPSVSVALSTVSPALLAQPIFFFDCVKGITCFNVAAEQTVRDLPAHRQQFLADVLTDTLLEAYIEARMTRQPDWPTSGYVLVATPVSREPDNVAGVLATVIPEKPLAPAERTADGHPKVDTGAWQILGATLRLHRAQPLVYVRRIGTNGNRESATIWQEYRLSHLEEALLRYLLEHRGEIQSPEDLFRAVWTDDAVNSYGLRSDQKDRLRRLVCQLRQHIEPDPGDPRYVCTAHGVGYTFYQGQEMVIQ
jgi:DNA-binding winged helix-turn-helix (wHTH) protein